MSLEIAGYAFEGPFRSTNPLRDLSGIYAICFEKDGQNYLIDVGESGAVKSRVENHDRADQWSNVSKGPLNVSVLYTPGKSDTARRSIEQAIRSKFNLPCGVR